MFHFEIITAIALFSIGLFAVTSKKDFLRVFFGLEMLLNSVILVLASSAYHFVLPEALSVAYLIIVIATLEASAGVLIFIIANRITGKIKLDDFNFDEVKS